MAYMGDKSEKYLHAKRMILLYLHHGKTSKIIYKKLIFFQKTIFEKDESFIHKH